MSLTNIVTLNRELNTSTLEFSWGPTVISTFSYQNNIVVTETRDQVTLSREGVIAGILALLDWERMIRVFLLSTASPIYPQDFDYVLKKNPIGMDGNKKLKAIFQINGFLLVDMEYKLNQNKAVFEARDGINVYFNGEWQLYMNFYRNVSDELKNI